MRICSFDYNVCTGNWRVVGFGITPRNWRCADARLTLTTKMIIDSKVCFISVEIKKIQRLVVGGCRMHSTHENSTNPCGAHLEPYG
jgi:hypothetical protein